VYVYVHTQNPRVNVEVHVEIEVKLHSPYEIHAKFRTQSQKLPKSTLKLKSQSVACKA